jgi:hypothetical protein
MSNKTITYTVGAFLGVFGVTAFCALVLVPAALIGIGILLGAFIVFEWPRVF